MDKGRPTTDVIAAFIAQYPTQSACSDMLRRAGYSFSTRWFGPEFRALTGIPKRGKRLAIPALNRAQRPALTTTGPIHVAEEPEELQPDQPPIFAGTIYSPDNYRKSLSGKRFVFTAAQNNSMVHDGFWQSLQAFCKEKGAQLAVSRLTYNKAGWAARGGVTKKTSEDELDIWYAPETEDYVLNEQVKVCEGLIFCGELDILPTAVSPLNGLDSYSGRNSAIVPHTKMHMRSLATMKHEEAKFLYTTGVCTLRNYIERRAGQIASHHHVYGAMYVEVDQNGRWFARQLNADDSGIFFDLDRVYTPQGAMDSSNVGQPVVTLGDIHVEKLDDIAYTASLDMMLQLNPKNIILHDLIDFEARNHHNKKQPDFLVNQFYNRDQTVQSAFELASYFIRGLNSHLPEAEIVAVRSNHDIAFNKWLNEGSGFIDPPNLAFWHTMNAYYYNQLKHGVYPDMYAHALYSQHLDLNVRLLQEDESYVIDGIEYGLHGHRGPNGARGNPGSYRQLGTRANTGHTHSAGIIDGVWTAGVLANLNMGYNIGPSSWSHSNIITYPNGKRQIVTIKDGKWRA